MTTRDGSDSPGINFPPPIVYVVPLALGFLVHRSWPVGIVPASYRPIIATIGWLLVFAAAALLLPAYIAFFRARTSLLPSRPASTVVQSGHYRWTRNPMYISITALCVGVACVFNALWPLLLVPISVVITDRYVIPREEAYLERAFGAEYTEYTKRVRRWL
jgi:protein-S-isoprenylcysteine O-methyltransferase Ste14